MSKVIASSDDAPLILQQWIYLGHRWNNGELVDCFICLPAKLGTYLHGAVYDKGSTRFFSADRKSKAIGGIYGILATEDGSRARTTSATFERMLDEPELVAEWRITSEAADVRERIRKHEKVGKRQPLACLDPIRHAYAKARTDDERRVIELVALRYIRGQ